MEAIREFAHAAPSAPLYSQLPEPVRKLVPGYLTRRRKDLDFLDEALEHKDFESVRRMGHDWKGSGTSYGLPAISEAGAAIEQAALDADADEIRCQLQRIQPLLNRQTVH